MAATTGQELIADAFALLNVFVPGESIPDADAQYALRQLNDWISEMSQRSQFVPLITRERFHLVADQGGPDNPYTIGPAGNWVTVRPSNQGSITAANLILTQTTPEVRVPLGIYTDEAYDANKLPGLSNTQPTALYYNPYYDNDLGKVYLWPIPTVSYNDIELFLQTSVAELLNLTSTIYLPDGYTKAFKYGLADLLQTAYGRTLSPAAQRIAISTVSAIKRSNSNLYDLPTDASFGSHRPTWFNINTGQ